MHDKPEREFLVYWASESEDWFSGALVITAHNHENAARKRLNYTTHGEDRTGCRMLVTEFRPSPWHVGRTDHQARVFTVQTEKSVRYTIV